jgi:tetratricopeptide (TPR) repeat protein
MKIVLNELDAPLEYQNMAVELEPYQPTWLLERGVTRELSRDYDGAILDFSKTIDLDPSNGEAYHRRGLAKVELGRAEEGKSDMIKAAALGYEDEDDEQASMAACQAAIDRMVEEVEEENKLHGPRSMEELEEERLELIRQLKEMVQKNTETE